MPCMHKKNISNYVIDRQTHTKHNNIAKVICTKQKTKRKKEHEITTLKIADFLFYRTVRKKVRFNLKGY